MFQAAILNVHLHVQRRLEMIDYNFEDDDQHAQPKQISRQDLHSVIQGHTWDVLHVRAAPNACALPFEAMLYCRVRLWIVTRRESGECIESDVMRDSKPCVLLVRAQAIS